MKKTVDQQFAEKENEKQKPNNSTVVDNNRLFNIIKQIEALEEEILRLQIKGILYDGTDGGN